jgi:hypothetical protein
MGFKIVKNNLICSKKWLIHKEYWIFRFIFYDEPKLHKWMKYSACTDWPIGCWGTQFVNIKPIANSKPYNMNTDWPYKETWSISLGETHTRTSRLYP